VVADEKNTGKAGSMGIRHGDTVKVMSGRSKGKTGKVLSVNPWKRR
jgi:ribosomal protein L24